METTDLKNTITAVIRGKIIHKNGNMMIIDKSNGKSLVISGYAGSNDIFDKNNELFEVRGKLICDEKDTVTGIYSMSINAIDPLHVSAKPTFQEMSNHFRRRSRMGRYSHKHELVESAKEDDNTTVVVGKTYVRPQSATRIKGKAAIKAAKRERVKALKANL